MTDVIARAGPYTIENGAIPGSFVVRTVGLARKSFYLRFVDNDIQPNSDAGQLKSLAPHLHMMALREIRAFYAASGLYKGNYADEQATR